MKFHSTEEKEEKENSLLINMQIFNLMLNRCVDIPNKIETILELQYENFMKLRDPDIFYSKILKFIKNVDMEFTIRNYDSGKNINKIAVKEKILKHIILEFDSKNIMRKLCANLNKQIDNVENCPNMSSSYRVYILNLIETYRDLVLVTINDSNKLLKIVTGQLRAIEVQRYKYKIYK